MYKYTRTGHAVQSDGTTIDSLDEFTVPDEAQAAMLADNVKAHVDGFTQTLPQLRDMVLEANADLAQKALSMPRLPQELLPGDTGLLLMSNESLLSVGAAGEVYQDGLRLGAARVEKLVRVGISIYGRGATDHKWYKWGGAWWTEVTASIDVNILK